LSELREETGRVAAEHAAETPELAPGPVDFPHTRLSRCLDGFIDWIGDTVSWLWLAVLGAIVINVIWRYALANNIGQLEELQWHIYSLIFLLGLSYCVTSNKHVRVDLLYDLFGLRVKAWVEFFGIVLFAAPFVWIVIRYGVPFVIASYEAGERSNQPSGLPYRFIVKSFLVFGFTLLAVALISRLTRVTALLFGVPRPIETDEDRAK